MRTKNQARKLKFLHTIFAVERDLIVGGQAVMEGVMMRTPSAYAIACRKADGTIVHTAEALPRWSDKYKWLRWKRINIRQVELGRSLGEDVGQHANNRRN